MGTKGYFVNAILNLIIMTLCLGFMFTQPITYEYYEVDGVAGFNPDDDQLAVVIKGWQTDSIRVQPNYFAGLTGALIISTIGFVFSISQWERYRNESEPSA